MDREISDFKERLQQEKVVAILRGLSEDESMYVAELLYGAGIHFIEIAYPSLEKADIDRAAAVIKKLRQNYDDLYVGAGTVLNENMVDVAHNAGAQFILSPNLDEKVVKRTLEQNMFSFPGALSPSELFRAYCLGATYVKWFPASSLGSGYLRALGEPMGYLPVMAVGGINAENMKEYYDAGASTFGIGGSLASEKLVKEKKFDEIVARARTFVEIARTLN